jgi:hypothetical protein
MNDDNTTEDSDNNDRRLARPISTEQKTVREATASVLETVTFQQNTVRQLLTQAYGDTGKPPPTELDPAADLLAGAVASQQQALASLVPESVRWPQANTAFHTAAGRMQQALEALRSQQPPAKDQKDNTMPSRNDSDYGDFQAALALRSLPVPNYTSAEIMAEESANQQKRARQKAARAGAKVEKNW